MNFYEEEEELDENTGNISTDDLELIQLVKLNPGLCRRFKITWIAEIVATFIIERIENIYFCTVISSIFKQTKIQF